MRAMKEKKKVAPKEKKKVVPKAKAPPVETSMEEEKEPEADDGKGAACKKDVDEWKDCINRLTTHNVPRDAMPSHAISPIKNSYTLTHEEAHASIAVLFTKNTFYVSGTVKADRPRAPTHARASTHTHTHTHTHTNTHT